MAESTQIPHLLSAYLQLPPEASLILISNVLNATSNWILLRYLLIAGKRQNIEASACPNVVFVSFIKDWDFWRDGVRRLGLDLNQATRTGRVTYIDGLSGLFSGNKKSPNATQTIENKQVLTTSLLDTIEASVSKSIASATAGTKPLLIIDGLDFLLAATQATTTDLLNSLMTWREASHSTVLTVAGDGPLLHAQQTPLEIDHAALVTSLIHQAYFVVSLRLLSTGAAKDVSGVIQIARGGSADEIEDTANVLEKEVLYLVGGDGNVKVFERGAG